MKKNLVVLSYTYFSGDSPVGRIASQYNEYLKEEYNISIICVNYPFLKNKIYFNNGENIYGINNVTTWLRTKCNFNIKNRKKTIANYCCYILLLVIRLIGVIQRIFVLNGLTRWYVKKAYKILCIIQKKEGIDLLFSYSGDCNTHITASKFKKKYPKILWATYTSDSASALFINRKKHKKYLKIEQTLFNAADINFTTSELINNNIFKGCTDKTIEIPYLIPLKKWDNDKRKQETIIFTYAGRFYSKIRNPRYMLEVMSKLMQYKTNIYSEGACQNIVDSYALINKNIERFNMVPKEVIDSVYRESNFLISVGNSIGEFQPSKIYEYISNGKPIVHFYFDNLIDRTLCTYPHCLQIKVGNDIKKSTQQIIEFVENYKNYNISREEIINIFPKNTNSYIKKVIISNLNDLFNK